MAPGCAAPGALRAAGSRPGAAAVRSRSCLRALLEVAAEGLAHCRENAVAPVGLAARGEAVEERGREHRSGHTFLDRGLHRPAALARVADAAGVVVQVRRLVQGLRGQVE